MTNFLLKAIPPQAAEIYRVLEKHGAKTAKEIGKELKIFPNAVYRAIKGLLELGLVQELSTYPAKFVARPTSESLDMIASVMRQNFVDNFGSKKVLGRHKLLKLIFIQKRKDILQLTQKDTRQTKESINLIASGLNVPAETFLVTKQAVERGVKVRWLVQNMKEVSPQSLYTCKKAGIEVKYYPNMEARIFIFDHKVVYFTSYDPKNIQEAIGMRFEYGPYANFMDELFEQRWKLAKSLDGA